jgi:hypothetical protein
MMRCTCHFRSKVIDQTSANEERVGQAHLPFFYHHLVRLVVGPAGRLNAMHLFTDQNAAILIIIGGLGLFAISTYLFERE